MKDLTLAGAMFTTPSAAFAELRERPRFALPLIAIILATVMQQLWYYNIVDIEWLKDQLTSGTARFDALTPEQRERELSAMTQNTMLATKVIQALFIPLGLAIASVYYLLAGKVTNVQYTFKQWFSFGAWSGLPVVVGIAASFAILAIAGTNAQMSPSELHALSLNELYLHVPPSHSGAEMVDQINPIAIWTWALSILGVKIWSGRSWLFSATFVMLPGVLIYGIAAYFIF